MMSAADLGLAAPPDAPEAATRKTTPEALGLAAPQQQEPSGLQQAWRGMLGAVGVEQKTADKIGSGLGSAWESIVKGNVLGVPGLKGEKGFKLDYNAPSALQRSAEIANERPYKPGMKMGEMIGPNALSNPMLYAMGTGNIGQGPRATQMAPDQAALSAKGVEMTPGQVVGGMAKGGEDIAKSFPILGHFISGARTRSIKSFNEATINQALEPIGASLPKAIQAGNDAVKSAGNTISKAYDDVLSRVPMVTHDAELKADLSAVVSEARKNPDVWAKYQGIVQHELLTPLEKSKGERVIDRGTWEEIVRGNAELPGRQVQRIDSELKRQARGYLQSEDFDKRELGSRLLETRAALMDAVERQYPDVAPDLQKANQSWAMLTRIEQAAGRRKTSDGVFTPNDLLNASASQAQGMRRGGVAREFARGDALFQDWAQKAQRVLPSQIPDSGTATRLYGGDIAAGLAGVGGMLAAPVPTLGVLGGLLGAGVPYAAPVSRAIQRGMEPGVANQRGLRAVTEQDMAEPGRRKRQRRAPEYPYMPPARD